MGKNRSERAGGSRAARLHIVRLVALGGAIALLALSAVSGLRTAQGRAATELDQRLTVALDGERMSLDEYFSRARDINLLVAQNPAFQSFDEQPGSHLEKIHAGGYHLKEANDALDYLERLYPGQIGEACFIDAGGAENARVVRGTRARVHELTADESVNPFFGPTFELPPGEVHQGKPYISPDTGEWVISNSTAVPSTDGRTRSIVHFEVTLESFRRRMAESDLLVRIADEAGNVVLDSRHAPMASDTPGRAEDRTLAGVFAGGVAGISRVGADRVAYAQVGRQPGNANRWFVAVSAHVSTGFSLRQVGWDASLLVLMALVLLAVAIWGFRAYQLELRAAALTDPLSGLPNRALFNDRARQALVSARRDDVCMAVLLIDLDRFKDINDTLGHHIGDAVLVEVAERLAGAVRECDTVARLGGDEFAVLLPRVDDRDAAVLAARRVLTSLDPAFTAMGVPLSIDASIGVAIAPDDGDRIGELVKCADIAMYDAKRSGHGISVYSSELDTSNPDRLAMVDELRVAIEEEQLELEYQPKVELTTGRIDGVEALIRWDHPRLGRLPAAEFIGLAEDAGMIRKLTAKVIEIGVAQCRAWFDEGVEIQVAINLSARCVRDPSTVDVAEAALARWAVPARLLKFEISETSLVGDTKRALEVLNRLAAFGITLSIDDYGTGYSSLAYLKELPIHELKIDRLFTKHLGEAGVDTNIVKSTVDLGHSLGLRVVAEGVETSRSASQLMDFGCDTAQGDYFSHPLSAEALAEWVRSSPPPEGAALTTAG